MIKSPMGPGFLIFFHRDRSITGGGDEGRKARQIFPSAAREWRATNKLRRKLAYHRKQEVDELLTPDVIEKVTDELVREIDVKPAITAYNIDHSEAERRLREFIEQYIQRVQDEELALILILASAV